MTEKEYDKEIGEFQNKVRDLIIETTGCSDAEIDGAGCDSGDWRDFTLCEISQGLAFLANKLTEEREALSRFLVPYRSTIPESWLHHFEKSGAIYFDNIGFVYPTPLKGKPNSGSEASDNSETGGLNLKGKI